MVDSSQELSVSDAQGLAVGKTAQERVQILMDNLPTLEFRSEDKLNLPLSEITSDEKIDIMKRLNRLFDDSYVSMNVYFNAGVNIPLRLLNDLDEERCERLLEILKPAVETHLMRENNMNTLKAVSGVMVRLWEGNTTEPETKYILTYDKQGKFDPIRDLPKTLNDVLGENIFSGATMEGGLFYNLHITDQGMERLRENPNLSEAMRIFQSPRQSSQEYRNSNPMGKLIGFVDAAFHSAVRTEQANRNIGADGQPRVVLPFNAPAGLEVRTTGSQVKALPAAADAAKFENI